VSVRAEAPRRPLELLSPRYVGILGIFLGALAFWLTLPPLTARTPLVSVLVGLLALAAGIWAVTRRARRVGWGAVAAGVLGIALGLLATQSSEGKLDDVVVWSALLASMLRFATPLTFAALGGLFSERSGVVNIGLEGMMLGGAFFAVLGADKLGSWGWGILCALAGGGGLALIHAFVSIQLRADQIVSGTAINFLALGLTGYFFIEEYGQTGTPGDIPRIPDVELPVVRDVAFIGDVIGHLNLMIWVAMAMVIVTYFLVFKTSIGLRLRSVGEHPRAADTVGISVYRTRYVAVTFSGMLAALGGAYLSIAFLGSFSENMTAGRGFIGLAALIFGNWRPFGAFAAALLFGFSTALAYRLDVYSESVEVLFQALPYVLTLIAVAGVIGRSIPPAAIGRPYKKQ
jgi:general nucleoside transport system permease protein